MHLNSMLERLARGITLALAYLFVVAVILNFANVVARYVFGRAILGADEIEIFIMVWLAFLGAVVVTWRGEHLRMDVLVSRLPASAREWVFRAELALVGLLAAFIAYQSGKYVQQMISIGRTSEAAGIPMAIPHTAVAVGFALMSAICWLRLWQRGASSDRAGSVEQVAVDNAR